MPASPGLSQEDLTAPLAKTLLPAHPTSRLPMQLNPSHERESPQSGPLEPRYARVTSPSNPKQTGSCWETGRLTSAKQAQQILPAGSRFFRHERWLPRTCPQLQMDWAAGPVQPQIHAVGQCAPASSSVSSPLIFQVRSKPGHPFAPTWGGVGGMRGGF